MTAPSQGPGRVRRIARLGLTAADLERSRRFYAALGFAADPPVRITPGEAAALDLPGAGGDRLTMRLGAEVVEVARFDRPGHPYPEGSTATDLWFQHFAIVVSDMGEAHALAVAAGAVPISRHGPEILPPNTGGVAAWKFRDPDGHPLELLWFPPGQGDPRWQARGAASPFLGIDHTALSVGDLARARAFYAGLGLKAAAGSLNTGQGQERLDDVFRDRVRVVPEAPAHAPPHLELLSYETGSRRPMPADTRADDVWATRTVFAAEPATFPRPTLLRDPDRHLVLVVDDDRA